jgi:hypothetical protein
MSFTVNEAGGFEAYEMYHGLKLHFTSNYDYVKYNGKTNVNKQQFMLRKDKFQFYKLSRKYKRDELFGFYVANMLVNPKIWVGELLTEDADSEYKVWQKTQQSISYVFEQDLHSLFDSVNNPEELLKVVDGQYPLLYTLYTQGKSTKETLIILNEILNFMPMWVKKVDDDIIFPEFIKSCEKYKPFLNYDKVKLKNLLKDKLCQLA